MKPVRNSSLSLLLVLATACDGTGSLRGRPSDAGTDVSGFSDASAADDPTTVDVAKRADGQADASDAARVDANGSTYVQDAGPDPQCTRVVIDMGDWSSMASVINQRTGTTGPGAEDVVDAVGTSAHLEKAIEDSMQIFSMNGAQYLRSTIRDGESWNATTYDRTEITVSGYRFAAGQKYILQWTGLIPQNLPTTGSATVLMQVHENNSESPAYEVQLQNGKLVFLDSGARPASASWGGPSFVLGTANDLINVPITLRLIYVPSSTSGYLKFEMNGQVITERTGQTTKTPGFDYAKFGTLYDWGNALVSPTSDAGRSYSLYTQTAWACEAD